MYHFDVLFLDTTSTKYYDRTTLEKEPLGGSEASVVRVAEGLASLGLKVCVVETQCGYFEPIMGQHCFFMHGDDIEKITCRHYIQIRRNLNSHLFPRARKYLWLHDVCKPEDASQVKDLIDNNIKVIGVSQWHLSNILSVLGDYKNATFIYNPVPEELYTDRAEYDRNIVVWLSSPHKGLGHALDLFGEVYKVNPKMTFIIFNPGYMQLDNVRISSRPGVIVYGPLNCKSMWNVVKKSLCVFYPTTWKETFGCIAAEANALGTPIATMPLAGLNESVNGDFQFCETDEKLVEKVLDWNKNGRPVVTGKDEFKQYAIVEQWVKLLAN